MSATDDAAALTGTQTQTFTNALGRARTTLEITRELLLDRPEQWDRVEQAVRAYGWDENDPRIQQYALAEDAQAAYEDAADRVVALTRKLEEVGSSLERRVDAAADRAVLRVENAFGTYAAQQLASFGPAFAKVATDVVKDATASVTRIVVSPWHRWMTVLVTAAVIGMAYLGGIAVGRAQRDEALRAYATRTHAQTIAPTRFVQEFLSGR